MPPGLVTRLSAGHAKAHALLVGSATIGIALALRARGIGGQNVAIPNGVCLNVPLAVLYSGNHPVYLDIDPVTLGLSRKILSGCTQRLAAVIAVHAYGAVCDIAGISAFCRERNLFLIEDLAAAQGARCSDRPVGAFGDVAVVSFGAGKIIDAGGGGAVMSDDASLIAEIDALEKELPERGSRDDARLQAFSRYHTQLYNDHFGRDLEAHIAPFAAQALELKAAFLSRPRCDFAKVAQELEVLPRNLAWRQHCADYLFAAFAAHDSIRAFRSPAGSVYWRFLLFLRSRRDDVLKTLLREGCKISSWFPSADLFLQPRAASGVTTPVSDRVGDEILNVWVNHEIDDAYLSTIADAIKRLTAQMPTGSSQ